MRSISPLLVALVLAATTGCTGELIPLEPDPVGAGDDRSGDDSGGASSPDAGAGAADETIARSYFDDTVQPLLALARPRGSCASCHEGAEPGNGPDFMGLVPADNYDALLGDARLVSDSPSTSLLVIKGAHAGDAFEPAEISAINEWILMESEQ